MKKKILSLSLSLLMVFSMFSAVHVAAADGVTERIVPVTAVESIPDLVTSGGASTDISDAVSSEPVDDGNGGITDAFCRLNKVSNDNSYLTVDVGYSAPITKVIVRSPDSTSGGRVAKLWYSTNRETFTEYSEVPDFANYLYRGAEHGMGGYDTKWDLSSAQINARYIRVGAYNNGPLKIRDVIVYTGDEAPALASLEVENGTHTLSPSFSADVYDYTVEVENLSELPALVFTAANGFTATETQTMSAENGYVSKITVARTGAPTDKKIYTVRAISTEFDAMLPIVYQSRGSSVVVDESYCSLNGGIDLSDPTTMYFSNETTPYYTVDLGRVADVRKVRYNQRQNNDASDAKGIISNATSVAYFENLEVSTDGINFTDVTAKATKTYGLNNDNLYDLAYYQIAFEFDEYVPARYIRVSNDGDGPLWIRGTEVFGKLPGDGISHSVADGTATVQYKTSGADARIILALYEIIEGETKPNATLKFAGAKVSTVATDGVVTASYDIPEGNTDKYVVKAFVLDSMGTIVPIAPSRGI